MLPSVAVTVTVKVPIAVGVRRLTVPAADLALSACEVAVTVTEDGLGTVAGAVYTPLEMVPYVEFPPVTPLTCQVTA